MCAIYVGMEFPKLKQMDRHSPLMFVYLVSVSVTVLLVKAIGMVVL